MIPILYEKDELAFVSNGLGRLRDCISCVVTEERNGIYECDFQYPVDGYNYDLIQPGRIVAVVHDETDDIQPFDIVSFTRPINGIVTFHCVHISYRQSKMTVSGTNINSLEDALNLLSTASPSNPFTYWTDKSSTAVFAAADGVPRSVRQMLGGTEGSILDCYGGEYEWDVWTVRLWTERGRERDFTIRYGVNLTDYNEDVDYSETYTACIPFWVGNDADNEQLVVKGNMVSADAIPYDGRVSCVPLDLSDKFNAAPTVQQLQDAATVILASKRTYIPTQTIKVDFIRLQDSTEYSNYEDLLYCKLCDSVKVVFPMYDTSGSFEIVKTEYDVLEERFNSMELGTLSVTFAEAIGDGGMSPSVSDVRMLEISTVAAQAAASAQDAADQANDILEDMQDAAVAAGTTLTQIYQDAADASTAASQAQTAAGNAVTAAQNAQTAAGNAMTAAQNAQTAAGNALTAAQNAQVSADSALVSLSTVEDVVGVLNWITAHGTMTLTSDVAINPAHVYFVVDVNGDYVVGGTHYSIVSEPDVADIGTYYELSVNESVQNYVATHLVVDSEGLWLVPDSGGNKVLIATGAGSSYTTAGTYIIGKVNGVDTVFAKFVQTGATMNATNNAQIAHLGYGMGTAEEGTDIAPYYMLGIRYVGTDVGTYSASATYKVGDVCYYSGEIYRCKTAITSPEAWNSSHWEIAIGNYSVLEGAQNLSSGYCSHAEGVFSKAIGYASHAEGGNFGAPRNGSVAKGTCSHAEGGGTEANGNCSHAEGSSTVAEGAHSHAQNESTIANGVAQTALGKYNVADTTSAVIIGNGTSYNARSNALTVDWNGDVNLEGQAKTSFKSSVAMGSYGSAQTTVPNLVDEVRFSSGCAGSVSIGTAYTANNVTIATGWYNFMYMPHRSGGVNGSASGDNCNYGNLFLFGMNNTNGRFIVRVSSGSIAEVAKIYTSIERYTRSNAGALDWSNQADGDAKVIMKSALAFWNGAYNGTGSNLKYSANGEIIGTNTGLGKTTWTPTSGSSYSNYGGCYYEKYGRVVHVHVGVSGLTTNTATNIYTLPSGYRPSSPVYAHGTGGAWNNIGYLEISTAGVVTVRSQGTYCGADITFLA